MEFLFKMVRGKALARIGRFFIFAIAVQNFIVHASRCLAEEGRSNTAEAASRIDEAIDQLGSLTFLERETASRELLHRGSTAIPLLESALQGAKGEVRYRIRSILDRQLRSSDMITRRAAQQAIVRIATNKDSASSQWARSILTPPGMPVAAPYSQQLPAKKQG